MSEEELLRQPADAYMNDAQRAFFRQVLETQKQALRARTGARLDALREPEINSDPLDVGSAEEQRQWQLRLLEREKKLLGKIDAALDRLARGEYGWCAETGEPIGLGRLLLRPTATLCVEAKERQERKEKHLRDA
ncbi:RNA polymerase-binding protein DksA [Pseudomonas sp. RIT-PI-AD]|uniref:RNA polymerase-binding protein DksA n=1 Tax=Pseudomonas sp. RIT-PI-AD TaxID=3035294 RepID=UPI0021D810E1|nr:RNA polymerase-binding protein DksA [Pseudomonas sp. RIT-PI-AD]